MTSTTTSAVSAGGTPPADPPSPATGSPRFASWIASWRVALRLARRDVRRHRGRSLAVLVMVGIPTMLICLALVLGATSLISRAESVPLRMGPAQASLELTDRGAITQAPDPSFGLDDTGEEARAIPGLRAVGTPEMNAPAIGELAGGEALPWTMGTAKARLDDRDLTLEGFAVADPQRLPGKITLRSGSWPSAPSEVLVSSAAVRRGVPESGSLLIRSDGRERTVTVVGTAVVSTSWADSHELLTVTPDLLTEDSRSSGWYVFGDQPLTWPDVERLNEYGLSVASAQVLRHPPAPAELSEQYRVVDGSSDQTQLVALGATLLLITVALLVGPAFAVGATRQRRLLALAASNGATAGQLRRTVLAQAIVLGGLSALIGAALSLPLAWVAARVIGDRVASMGPFDVPWWQLAAICGIALLASVLAALVPAQRLTRLDIVGAMRGRIVTPPPSRWLFALGLVVAGVGGAGVILGLDQNEVVITVSAVLLVLGALLLVPRILHALGALAGPLPLPLRLGVRDLARHRTRSAPTVAAVLAGTAALTMGLIGATSDDAQERADYVGQNFLGEGSFYSALIDDSGTAAELTREVPSLIVTPVHQLGTTTEITPGQETVTEPFAAVIPQGCTVPEIVAAGQMPGVAVPEGEHCWRDTIGQFPMSSGALALMPSDEIIRRFDLTGAEARAIEDGGGLLLAKASAPEVQDGQVTIAQGSLHTTVDTGESELAGEATISRVPVVLRPRTSDAYVRATHATLLLPTETARSEGWPLVVSSHLVRDANGPITQEAQERLQQMLGDEDWLQVERGWQNPLGMIIAILLGIFTVVLVVVTLTATALSMAEQERDQATIAAVGGSRRTRLLMVAAQTWLLAALGVALGVAVGAVPGITIARALTSEGWDPITGEQVIRNATIDIPWLALATAFIAVPAIAALLAGLAIRRTPSLTRRVE